ncbi:MAG: hypothetical protein JNM17_19920 [Archangium sp.]|nr:hypothetical protein [Archangium sp.]
MRLAIVAAVLVVLGAAILVYFVQRGATVVATPKNLMWSRGEPDGGERELVATWFGVEFLRIDDADEPALSNGVLHRGDEWMVLEECNCFDQFAPVDGGVWVMGEWCTEGGGPSAEILFLSVDGGVQHIVTLPKPVYWATLRDFTVTGDTLSIRIEADTGEGPIALPDEWVLPPWRVEPLTRFRPGAGPWITITSKNGGRSWRMDRYATSGNRDAPPP